MVIGEILKNTEKLKENLRVITNPRHPVNFKNKTTSYFTSKISLEMTEEL